MCKATTKTGSKCKGLNSFGEYCHKHMHLDPDYVPGGVNDKPPAANKPYTSSRVSQQPEISLRDVGIQIAQPKPVVQPIQRQNHFSSVVVKKTVVRRVVNPMTTSYINPMLANPMNSAYMNPMLNNPMTNPYMNPILNNPMTNPYINPMLNLF